MKTKIGDMSIDILRYILRLSTIGLQIFQDFFVHISIFLYLFKTLSPVDKAIP